MENYTILQKIGSGNFAKVYLALHAPSGKQVALKFINKKDTTSMKTYQRVHREIRNMKKLTHANITEIYESFETDHYHVIAMEYVPGGELFDYVWEKQGLTEEATRDIFTQIVRAVEHCHQNSVVHRDLKLENILLDRDGHPKLADFGFSKESHTQQMLATYCGSPLYASPEMVLGKPYSGPECDVWSLGVVLYSMLTASMPFDDRDLPRFMHSLERGEYPDPPGTSEMVRSLISRMLDSNAETRATIQEILSHPWMKNNKTRKISEVTVRRHRKSNLCYSRSQAMEVTRKLIEINTTCSCSCHESEKAQENRESVIMNHCSECADSAEGVVKNIPKSPMLDRNVSNASSGYSSEAGSAVFTPVNSHSSILSYFSQSQRGSVVKSPTSQRRNEADSRYTQTSLTTAPTHCDETLVFV